MDWKIELDVLAKKDLSKFDNQVISTDNNQTPSITITEKVIHWGHQNI